MDSNKHELEIEFEKELSRPPVKQRALLEILEDIKAHRGMLRLFHLLKQNPSYGEILFLHPLDLFGKKGRYQIPHFFYGEGPTKKSNSEQMQEVLRVLEVDLQAEGSEILKTVLGKVGIDVTDESLGHDILDVIVYALVSLFRISPKLLELAKSEDFNYQQLRKMMKDYTEVLDNEKLKRLIESILAEQSSDPELINHIRKLILTFTPILRRNPLEFLRTTKISQSELAISYHKLALSFLEPLLAQTSANFEVYTRLMQELYLFELIGNIHTIFWCERCSKEKISYLEFHGSLSPAKMGAGKCRVCSGKEFFSSIFIVDQLLLDAIFSRDHLLGVYMTWRLEDANIEYQTGRYVSDREIDILVGDTLIECKSFRLGGRDDTSRSNLEGVIRQTQKQITAFEEEGHEIKRAILLSNQPELRNEQDQLRGELKDIVESYDMEIIDYTKINELIESLV